MSPGPPARPEVAVGGVCVHHGRLLVVRRAAEPGAGRWSLPGGRVRGGEALPTALVREMAEETGLTVRVGDLCGIAERIGGSYHYVILDFWVTAGESPRPAPGDDAVDVRWADNAMLGSLNLVDDLHSWLADHGVLAQLD